MEEVDRPQFHAALERFLLLVLVLLALAARLVPGPRTVDDAYITFRYARNLVEGRGFVYNLGERVLGTTTPLYTLLLSGLAFVTGRCDFPAMAMAVNGLAGAVSVLLLYHLGRRFSGQRAVGAAAALLWALAPHSVTFAIGGMETDLTIALILAAFLAHLARCTLWMALYTALAFLARPDTLIATGPLFLDLWIVRRRFPWRETGVALGSLAPWLLFAILYFGNPLPASIAAKSAAYRLPPTADLVRLLQHYATPFSEFRVLPPLGVVLVFGLYVGLSALGGRAAFWHTPRTWVISLYPFTYAIVFALANPLLFRWYLSPPLPAYFLLILTGVWKAASDLGKLVAGRSTLDTRHSMLDVRCRRLPSGIQYPVCLFALFTTAVLTLTLNAWALHPDHGPGRPAPEMAWFELELLYARAADIVGAQAREGDTLCAGDIGVLGYRTGLRILDTVGLVTPQAHRYYPADPAIYVINYAIPADLVLNLDPDYVVILEVYGRRGLLPDPRFQARYRLLERIATDIYGSEGMLVFGRR
ncbi:MAG TPA: hypothetical protein ENI39_01490 [Anaerolineae bacterium]|nr:hypothetical protein [Anaerolineae bacterium]